MVENTNVVEKKENKKKRGLIVILAALLMGSTVAGNLFGYWTESVTAPNQNQVDNNLVTIGTGNRITGDLVVTQAFTVSETLVPNGRTSVSAGGSITEEISRQLTAEWNDDTNVVKETDNVTGTLKITPVVQFADGSSSGLSTLQKLVKVTIESTDGNVDMINTGTQIKLQGSVVNANLKAVLTEPENKSEYDEIRGKQIKIVLTYTVENVQN